MPGKSLYIIIVSIIIILAIIGGAIAYYYLTPPTTTPIKTTPLTASPTLTTGVATPTTPPTVVKELILWKQVYADPYAQSVWERVYKEFEAATGIHVKAITWEPSDGNNKMMVALTVKSPELLPHVSNMIGELASMVCAPQGCLEPLDDIYEWLKANWGNDLVIELFELMKWPGPDGKLHIYQLPWGASVWMLNLRYDIMKQAGLKPEDFSTFDKLNASLYYLRDYFKSKGIRMIPFDIQLSPTSLGDAPEDVDMLFTIFAGVHVYDPKTKMPLLNATPENFQALVKVLEVLKKWYDDGILPKGAITESDMINNVNFINGITFGTPNNVGTMIGVAKRQHPEWEYIVLPLPASDKHPEPFGILMPRTFLIPAYIPPEAKQAAKEFIKFVLNKTNYEKWYGYEGGFEYTDIPIYKSMLDKGAYVNDTLVWKPIADIVKKGKLYVWSRFASFTFAEVYNNAVYQIREQEVIVGAKTPEEAAKSIVAEVYKIWNKWKS